MEEKNKVKKSNICLFSSPLRPGENEVGLKIVNMVYEREHLDSDFIISAHFKVVIVFKGKGTFQTLVNEHEIKRGNAFIIFPGTTPRIINEKNLEFAYISLYGAKAYELLESSNILKYNFFSVNDSLIKIWHNAFQKGADNLSLLAEGLFYITLSYLKTRDELNVKNKQREFFTEEILKRFNELFCDKNFNLGFFAKKINYSPNYISSLFNKYTGLKFNNYLALRRKEKALSLMHSGITSVKDIAQLCGYEDPLYFSKVFKRLTGLSPLKYIQKECKSK